MTPDIRRLIEKAAKAAGVDLQWHEDERDLYDKDDIPFILPAPPNNRRSGDGTIWNPLEFGDQALDLAMKLGLEIVPIEGGGVDVCHTTEDEPFGTTLASESGPNRSTAARLAILRAAASLAERSKG